MSKSFVTMERCVICGKDTGTLFLNKRLKNTFEMHTSTPTSVCDKCKKKYLKYGVMLIVPENGNLTVIKDSAFKRIFDKPIPKGKIAFTDDALLLSLNNGRWILLTETTKKQFLSYEKVRKSGKTNMMDVQKVSELSGLRREKIIDIITTYGKLSEAYL